MAQFESVHFGVVDYQEDAVLHFPAGLPAFEDQTRFLTVQNPDTAPVVFLQSLTRADLVFITLPALLVDPNYRLSLLPEDLELLGLPADAPDIPADVYCLVIVTVTGQTPPTANLLAPVVINPKNRRAAQVIQAESDYSHQHRLPALSAKEDPTCS